MIRAFITITCIILHSVSVPTSLRADESTETLSTQADAAAPTATTPSTATDVWGTFFFPEDRPAPGHDNQSLDFKFGWHGYLRSPMRLASRAREDGSGTNLRSPWLIDDDYYLSGFAYTRNQETDYSEIFLMGGNRYITGTVGLFGSLFSDAAYPDSQRQLGIAQGFVTLRYEHQVADVHARVRLKGGSFWDRFGYLAKYDTYVFGRTHQAGMQAATDLEYKNFVLSLIAGVGSHLEQLEASQGLATLRYGAVRLAYDQKYEVGIYRLDTGESDLRQLKDIKEATLDVTGIDARFTNDFAGRLYVAYSHLSATRAQYMSPVLEVMHSYGGKGLTDNYFGSEASDNGTGGLNTFAFQYDYSLAALLRNSRGQEDALRRGKDVLLSVFGVYTKIASKQADLDPMINRDGRRSFKWGADVAWWPTSWVGASVRYDRVVLNVDDEANSMRILSPRLSFRARFMGEGLIFLQYSRYGYGERIQLRAGQVPLETLPDQSAFKIQAQLSF
ncbi:MAG: hypothetical protein SF187_27810 [Deltaproteobacteria bacterium]|nr:hypothetical protein [Deltaproteobacteria bacterium]